MRNPTFLLMVMDSIFPTSWNASSLMVFILPLYWSSSSMIGAAPDSSIFTEMVFRFTA